MDVGIMRLAFETARDLRKRTTVAENAFWQIVRNRRFLGLKFKRQFPVEFEYDGAKRYNHPNWGQMKRQNPNISEDGNGLKIFKNIVEYINRKER